MNHIPKIRFQQSEDNIKKHQSLVESRDFQRGADFALLHYQAWLSDQKVDGQGAAASHFKMAGAREFLQVFQTLHEKPQPMTMRDQDNLQQPN